MAARCTGSYVLQEFDLPRYMMIIKLLQYNFNGLHWFNDMEIVPTIGRDAKL